MRPSIIILLNGEPPLLADSLRSRFKEDGIIRFHALSRDGSPEDRAEKLIRLLNDSYSQTLDQWKQWQFQLSADGQQLEREILFFYIVDLADAHQVDLFVNSIEAFKSILPKAPPLPVSFGGWLTLPQTLDAQPRLSVFTESLQRLHNLLSDSTKINPLLFVLRRPFSATSETANTFITEEVVLLTEYLENNAVRIELERLQGAGEQLRPLGKESPFSVMNGITLQYDSETVAGYLNERLIQKLINDHLLHAAQPDDYVAGSWFAWYRDKLRNIVELSLDCFRNQAEPGAKGADGNEAKTLSETIDASLQSLLPNKSLQAAMVAFQKDIFIRYRHEIDTSQSLARGTMFLEFLHLLKRALPEYTHEQNSNIAELDQLILELLVPEDSDLIGKCLQGCMITESRHILNGPWLQNIHESLTFLSDIIAQEQPASATTPEQSAGNFLRSEMVLAQALLKAASTWPVKPEIITTALHTFAKAIEAVFSVMQTQEQQNHNILKELHEENKSVQNKSMGWKLLHHSEFQNKKIEIAQKMQEVQNSLVEVQLQMTRVRDDIFLPWVKLGARWYFILTQVAQVADFSENLFQKELKNIEPLRDRAMTAIKNKDGIRWLKTPPRIDVICREECENLFEHEAMERKEGDEFFASWMRFPEDAPTYANASYAKIQTLSDFIAGKIPVLLTKLEDFAAVRLMKYKAMDLAEVVAIVKDDRFRRLLETSQDWISPWMIIDASRSSALGNTRPLSVCLIGMTEKNRSALEPTMEALNLQTSYYGTSIPNEISLMSFTCGIPAFLIEGNMSSDEEKTD